MVAEAEHDLLTMREAAEFLRVSEVTISRWIKQGRLPSFHVGPRAVRIRRADVDAMLRPVSDAPPTRYYEFPADATTFEIPPLTKAEAERQLQALDEAERFAAALQAQRGGRLFPSSTEIIREERDKRSRKLAG
ncbi:MAG: helix-turn-helix domain-containing protein [Thermomicrobiales bacterium]